MSLGAEHVFVGLGVLYASWRHLDATVAIAENKHEPSRVRAPLLHAD